MLKTLSKKRKGGFTLIELLVVMVIIGILAAIAIPRFSSITGEADTTAAEANERIMETAAQMWLAENGVPDADQTNVNVAAYVDTVPTGYTVDIAAGGAITVNYTAP